MIVIGEDSSERLDKTPAQYRVIVTKRPKLACRACPGTVVQEPAPPRLIEAGIPTEALVAQVVVSRFADHQPLYRQAQMMAREGVIIERSTLSSWIGYAAAEVAPVVERLREMLLASSRIFGKRCSVALLAFRSNQWGLGGAHSQGRSSSRRFSGQPFTKRVSTSWM
jgi:transposase